ncbi:MAG: hypothetical protein GF405_10120 [Candidatus Eisenbacteria bacterium]|nr:hypothetical protein [Candidatus Eisenbacteria bacterium]
MAPKRRWTRALPIVVLAAGLLIPAFIGRDDPAPAVAADTPASYAGRTAAEWERLADRAADAGSLDRALKYLKSAERVAPGTQYADRLHSIRRRRWAARELAALRRRFLEGAPAKVEYTSDGDVAMAYRTTPALPGENLWSLATGAARAEHRLEPGDEPERRLVYAWWDRLTELNGLRELEVGEEVLIPLLDEERQALAAAAIEDLQRIDRGFAELESGDIDGAEAVLASVRGSFARGTGEYALLVQELEDERARLRRERESGLVARAHELAARADTLSRATAYDDYVSVLDEARRALEEAEGLTDGEQYSAALRSVDALVAAAERVRVEGDGTVVVLREPGEPFTDAALEAVEWLLERELHRGDAEFPEVDRKTPDQIAWARFLYAASELAEERGIELAAVLTSSDGGEIVLPHPSSYFDR